MAFPDLRTTVQQSSVTHWCQATVYYNIFTCHCCIWKTLFFPGREFLSLFHGLVDTIKIPLENTKLISQNLYCSKSNSNDRHSLISLVQQKEPEQEKATLYVLPLSKYQHHPSRAKLQITINTLYTFAAQGRIIGGWSTDIHSS